MIACRLVPRAQACSHWVPSARLTRSQLTQSGLCVLGARLVGEDVDENLAEHRRAERQQLQLPACSLKRLSRYVLPHPACVGVIAVGAIEPAHHRADVAEVRTNYRAIGVGERRIDSPFPRPFRRERGQRSQLQ